MAIQALSQSIEKVEPENTETDQEEYSWPIPSFCTLKRRSGSLIMDRKFADLTISCARCNSPNICAHLELPFYQWAHQSSISRPWHLPEGPDLKA